MDDQEIDPQQILYTNQPYASDEEGYDDEEEELPDYAEDSADSDEDADSSDQASTSDEDDLAEAIGDVIEPGFLKALEGQNIPVQDGHSQAQKEVFLITWKGAMNFRGRSKDRKPRKSSKSKKRAGTPHPIEKSVKPRNGDTSNRSTTMAKWVHDVA